MFSVYSFETRSISLLSSRSRARLSGSFSTPARRISRSIFHTAKCVVGSLASTSSERRDR